MSWGTLGAAEEGAIVTVVSSLPGMEGLGIVYRKQRKMRGGMMTKRLAWWVLSSDQDSDKPHVFTDFALDKALEDTVWWIS